MAAEVQAPPVRVAEQRKERSRDAARSRRGRETEVLYELGRQLPLPRGVISHLDKASIMRVTISYLRLRRLLEAGTADPERADLDGQFDGIYLRALDGFIMVLTEEGDIVYLTENVNKYLGLTQLDLIGHSIFEFVHPCDEEELKDFVTPQHVKQGIHTERDFFMRMKSTLTSRGRTVAIKSATWKVLHCTGHVKRCEMSSQIADSGFPEFPMSFLLMICEPIPHPSNIEISLDSKTFLSHHSLDMKFIYCDQKITDLIGYHPKAMLGHTSYEFYHSLDSDHMTKTHRILLNKGQVTSDQYRFLAKNGGYVWLKTQATAIYNSKNSRPQCIVCINSVLSSVLEDTVIFSLDQRERSREQAADLETDQDLFVQCNQSPEKLDEPAPTPGDTIVPPDFTVRLDSKAFHFTKTLPEDSEEPLSPEEFCTPELCKLLSPIFDHPEGLRSSSDRRQDSEPLNKAHKREREVTMPDSCESSDTDHEIKYFCFDTEVVQNLTAMGSKAQQTETDQVSTELDLEMLAPYISMEEDFQLSSFESPEEKDGRACSDQRLDTDPKDRPTTQDGSRGLSEALTVPETGDTTAFRPQPSSLHAIQSSKPASSQGEALYRSLRGALRPQGGAAASQRSSNMTRLSVGRAPGSSSKSMAFGGPAFTAAVENVLLALFQPQTSASPPETGIHIGQSARTNGQDADSLKSGAELEPSAQLDSAGTESAVPAEPSRERYDCHFISHGTILRDNARFWPPFYKIDVRKGRGEKKIHRDNIRTERILLAERAEKHWESYLKNLKDWVIHWNSLPNSTVGVPTPHGLQRLKKAAHHHLLKGN
ncbi:hypoxia-inducible factor 1-alpha-like isoform X2 [Carcharodon carcharias]|uniref:hypoxia-inducible factor 1-alpha-like isoform X2 n=1 Tax=Carcharodon carcharias TaxID=13397 RepID=UPI001B7E299D|nr:hypoxia-inducible factor 1-alpha-like isoform X2 [Carcharodon carcharias]